MKNVNTYLADLWQANMRIHNYHWNVVGHDFKAVHVYLEEIYDGLFEATDAVAEYLRKRGELPASSMKDYMELITLPDAETKEIKSIDAMKGTLEVIQHLFQSAKAIVESSDDYLLNNLLEDQMAEYEKNIWFIRAMLTD